MSSLGDIRAASAKSNVANSFYCYALDAANLTFDNINLPSLAINSATYIDAAHNLKSSNSMSDGQILIGASGMSPAASTITAGIGGNMVVTNTSNAITLTTVTNPTFASVTFTGSASPGVQTSLQTVSEQQTWTPLVSIGGSSTGIVQSGNVGIYTKVGRTVYITGYVAVTDTGGNTGTVTITGLPFTSTVFSDNACSIPCSWSTFTFVAINPIGLVVYPAVGNLLIPYQLTSTGGEIQCTESCFSPGTSIITFNGFYYSGT